MDDRPYTTPEEDPFNVQHTVQLCPRQRKTSLLNKWIQEQQRYADHPPHSRSHSTPLNYLAYPELGRSDIDRPGSAGALNPHHTAYDLVHDNDILSSLDAAMANIKLSDIPATIRSSKRSTRMSITPSSFRPFNVFRSPSTAGSPAHTEENPSRPSSRLSLFTRSNRNSADTVTSRETVTQHSTPQRRSKRASYISVQAPLPPRRKSPSSWKIRPHTTSSKWRPSVVGHFGDSEPVAPAASQTSIQAPPSDSVYTPSRPSLSSSADVSHAHTSLTVPSVDGGSMHNSPTSEEQKESPSINANAMTQTQTQAVRPRSGSKRYSTSGAGTVNPPVPQPQFQQNRGSNAFSSPSSVSLRSAYPSSINTNTNIHDVFGSSDREIATPSPTYSSPLSGKSGLLPVTGPYGVGQYPRMYPFAYGAGVQSQTGSIGSKRSGNAFDAIPSAWRYPTTPASAGFEYDVDDVDDEFTLGSNCSWAKPVSQQSHSGQRQQRLQPPQQLHPQDQQQHESVDRKTKPHVVYAQGGSGGTLSKMTSFSNLALSPMLNKKKKKRLVISGVAVNDVKKFEGVKKWCESFGEVRQILRMPNGDLVVSYQSAEVADTVCRVRAKVIINGVGSVQLSWTTEKKR